MKQNRKVLYIQVNESRGFHSYMPEGKQLVLTHRAYIQDRVNGRDRMRSYYCSHWSIKRLAKIQEKLVQ